MGPAELYSNICPFSVSLLETISSQKQYKAVVRHIQHRFMKTNSTWPNSLPPVVKRLYRPWDSSKSPLPVRLTRLLAQSQNRLMSQAGEMWAGGEGGDG